MTETPQTKDGFTGITNELMDALVRTRIPGEARQVLDAIIRKTYGWGKTSDDISLSQFMIMTGLSKSTICKAVKKLLAMNMIIKKGCAATLFTKQGKAIISTYSVQKEHKFWKPLPKKKTLGNVTQKGNLEPSEQDGLPKKETLNDVTQLGNDVTQKGNLEPSEQDGLPKKETLNDVTQLGNDVTQKGNLTLPKKSPTKESLKKTTFSPNSVEYGLAKLLFDLIRKRNPGHKHPDLSIWSAHIDRMINLDGRKADDIEAVIRWCQSGESNESKFWNNNILSTEKLREKFDQLKLKMEVDRIKRNPPETNHPANGYKPAPMPVRTASEAKHISDILKAAGDRVFGRRRVGA